MVQVRASGGSGTQLLKKADASADEQAKELEKRVHECLEASAAAAYKGDVAEGLEKASEAKKRERALTKFREQNGLDVNPDLTYAIDFNLAHINHLCKNYKEALDQFTGENMGQRQCCCSELCWPVALGLNMLRRGRVKSRVVDVLMIACAASMSQGCSVLRSG